MKASASACSGTSSGSSFDLGAYLSLSEKLRLPNHTTLHRRITMIAQIPTFALASLRDSKPRAHTPTYLPQLYAWKRVVRQLTDSLDDIDASALRHFVHYSNRTGA